MLTAVVALGLLAGGFGGLLGVGGSVLIIPGLTLLFGPEQHLYQAAAMVLNISVALPAVRRHTLAGCVDFRCVRWVLPGAIAGVGFGVALSNTAVFRGAEGGMWLGRVLAAYLLYTAAVNAARLWKPRAEDSPVNTPRVTATRCLITGLAMGGCAGLLGVGGGVLAVPMQQTLLGLPLVTCIGNSSAIMCITAAIGAVYKNATLGTHGLHWHQSLVLWLWLIPSCWLGSRLGAGLTHRLSVRQVRAAFAALLTVAAYRMSGLPWLW